ncbi:SIR2 family protein [Citrobacter sp. Cm046]|uniref:SIR2 family NAD-dependent protein deacylase n=1 Tax=Citrobacter sp. Cm046 TaxID=2985118 RepID=UPI002575614B|nr:SIR2 family protein [Citrobacter sp. Cm046]MDM2929388.1 SIR2 family protein [Citrobacter sp. Cm046]
MDTKLSSLPDYPALKKLASALWQQDNTYHGAAVMVGAGFSRSCASTGDTCRKLPLWLDFSKTLSKELDSGSSDPLRLAEEYDAYFGKQALHELIKKEVNDAAWIPGELHYSLLELPWSEVLTTNWDTLLERASTKVHSPVYSIVSKQEDLSNARSPRIVKLHGTIDVTKRLIFTQEDYRKYPQAYAAYVNFARQVFIENELCLLGFSGDDPNFLQWAGWVRDNLATHSRRIYLVGALKLNAAKRKYLESINVSPIDLEDLVADYDDLDIKHQKAMNIFLGFLQNMKPNKTWEWQPTSPRCSELTEEERKKTYHDSLYASKFFEEQLPILQNDRKSYPGWLICPHSTRWDLQNQFHIPTLKQSHLSYMTTEVREQFLYEICWRYEKSFDALPSWLIDDLLMVCDPKKTCVLSKRQQLEIALQLLKNTRWVDNSKAEPIIQITSKILEDGIEYWPECNNELAYHQAIVSRDRFDYIVLEESIKKITSCNPEWKIKKASLLAEIGDFDKGEELITEAYKELLVQYRNDKNSIYILSRLAWAQFLMKGIHSWLSEKEYNAVPLDTKIQKCDPWDHIEHSRKRIADELTEQQNQQIIEPSFEPGRFKDNSNKITFSNAEHPLLLLEGIAVTAGLPMCWDFSSFFAQQATMLSGLESMNNIHRFSLAIRSANSDTSDSLKNVFSRIRVACFPQEDVEYLLSQCTKAIEYWSQKRKEGESKIRNHSIDRLRVFIEVLARVSIRATPEQARRIFLLALSLGKKNEFHHFWLFDSLKNLMEFSLESIPESEHSELLLETLMFPLRTEIELSGPKEWVNPIIEHPGKRKQNSVLDRRLDEIIDRIAPCSSQSAPALLRLLPLLESKFLTHEEENRIADQVWGKKPDYEKIPDTGLYFFALLKIPSRDIYLSNYLLRSKLFEAKGELLLNNEQLINIVNATRMKELNEFPTSEQAVLYFNELVTWSSNKIDNDVLGLKVAKENRIAELIGYALAYSIIPALSSSELTEKNFELLYSFYESYDSSEVLIALAYFAAANETFASRMENIYKKTLQDKNPSKVVCTSWAIYTWRKLNKSHVVERLIIRLIYLIGPNRTIGLKGLLQTANKMYSSGYLSEKNIEPLVEILPIIFDNTDYNDINPTSRESVSISLVRTECVKLANDILEGRGSDNKELLRILEEATLDPLPEVRFSIIDKFE